MGETEGGGSHRVDRVGCGKGSKVVVPGQRVYVFVHTGCLKKVLNRDLWAMQGEQI